MASDSRGHLASWIDLDVESGVGVMQRSDQDSDQHENQGQMDDQTATIVAPAARRSTTLQGDRSAWSELDNDKAIKEKDDEGTFVVCLPCSLKLSSTGSQVCKIKMRHPFKTSTWLAHCQSTRHMMNYQHFIHNEYLG
jgi:hypothetical protein